MFKHQTLLTHNFGFDGAFMVRQFTHNLSELIVSSLTPPFVLGVLTLKTRISLDPLVQNILIK